MKKILKIIASLVLGEIVIVTSVYASILMLCLLTICVDKFALMVGWAVGVPLFLVYFIMIILGTITIGDKALEKIQELIKSLKNK